MTVAASQANRFSYAGNGVTTAFAYSSKFVANADLVVVLVDDDDGSETVKTITTHYTVTGAGDANGGTVTMVTAPAVGETLVIYGDPVISQLVDPVNGDNFDVDASVEAPLDKLTIITRRIKDIGTRAIRLADGVSSAIATTLSVVGNAGKYVRLNAGGTAFEFADGDLNTSTFTQSGTGATERTVTAKLGESVSVKDFGATGDGSTNDTANIRKAVAALKAAGGGALYFPPGTYIVDPSLNSTVGTGWNTASAGEPLYAGLYIDCDDITLFGHGDATLKADVSSVVTTNVNSLVVFLGTSGTPINRARVFGLNFDLNNEQDAMAVYCQWVRDVQIRGNHFKTQSSAVDAVVFENTSGAVASGNTFRSVEICFGCYESVNTTIEANVAFDCAELVDADKPVTSGTGTAAHGLAIVSNTYDRTSDDTTRDGAIEVNGFTDVVIANNTIRNANSGIHLTAKVRNATDYALERAVIKGNTIVSCNGVGINMASNGTDGFVNFEDITIDGNTINGGTVGIRLRGEAVVCRGNTVRAASGIGINALDIGSSQNLNHFVIAENIVSDCGSDGIQLDTSTNGVVANNRCYDNTDTNGGIYLETVTKVTVSGNLTTGHTNAGIRTFGGTGEVLLMGNICTEANGIRTASGNLQSSLGNQANYYPGADSSRNLYGPTVAWGTAAPAAGTWAQGSVVWRTDMTANEHPGWVCTAAGAPGTWKAMANVAA